MKFPLGKAWLEMGSRYLTELTDSSALIDDTESLRCRLSEDGYLLLRGFHDRELVLRARMEFLRQLQQMGRLAAGTPLEDGIIGEENKAYIWGKGRLDLANDFPAFLEVVEGERTMSFFSRLLDGPALTYDYKWPRAVPNGGNTGAHYDVVYMGRGTKNVYTMWTPLDDIPYELGTLAMLLGSHRFERVKATYGEMDVDRDNVAKGWLSEDPVELVDTFGGQWATTEFGAGDVAIFGMFLMHASLNNTTNRYRLSADTRFQLASEPVDERWVGAKPKAHYAWNRATAKSVEEARKEWGI